MRVVEAEVVKAELERFGDERWGMWIGSGVKRKSRIHVFLRRDRTGVR